MSDSDQQQSSIIQQQDEQMKEEADFIKEVGQHFKTKLSKKYQSEGNHNLWEIKKIHLFLTHMEDDFEKAFERYIPDKKRTYRRCVNLVTNYRKKALNAMVYPKPADKDDKEDKDDSEEAINNVPLLTALEKAGKDPEGIFDQINDYEINAFIDELEKFDPETNPSLVVAQFDVKDEKKQVKDKEQEEEEQSEVFDDDEDLDSGGDY